jgi:NAD+ diphosphatase
MLQTMTQTFFSAVPPPSNLAEPAYWFVFRGYKLLVSVEKDGVSLPRLIIPAELDIRPTRQQYLGYLENGRLIHCYSCEVDETYEAAEGMEFRGLRSLYGQLDEDMFWLAGRAIQIVDWDRTHQFCSRCGANTETMPKERAKQCPNCGFTSYPRLSPAIIVRVERSGDAGPEILLARSVRHPSGMYSVLAGFVEPGETLEECVRREVREEVGIDLKNIRYFGSQPWPFPNSLMVAFTADYAGGDIVLEEEEMADAGWYRPDALPPIPPSISIARQLIDSFLRKHGF